MSSAFSSGEAYERFMGRWSKPVAQDFVEWVKLSPAATVLDVGCGTGALSHAMMGNGAKMVIGIDPSPQLVAYARSLVPSASVASFEVGDATNLRFTDNYFDAVLSGLVLNFIPDTSKGVAEMARVVKPAGVVAAYVWDYAAGSGLMRVFWEAATSLDPNAQSLDETQRFELCRPDRLRELFGLAGLEEVTTRPLKREMTFRDFNDFWHPILGGQGPIGMYVAGLDEARREELRREVQTRLASGIDGQIHLDSRAWAVRGSKINRR